MAMNPPMIPASAAMPFDIAGADPTLAALSPVAVGRRRFMIGSASAAGGLMLGFQLSASAQAQAPSPR